MTQTLTPTRILFLRSGGHFVELLPPDAPMVGPPRSLLYLAGALRGEPGIEVRLLDVLAEPDFSTIERERSTPPFYFGLPEDRVVERVRAFNPHILAVTSPANYYMSDTVKLISRLRRELPGLFIVVGGPDATADYEDYFRRTGAIDVIVMREGEVTFRELVRCWRSGEEWRSLEGIAYRQGARTVVTPPRAYIAELDSVRPDYSIVDLERYFELNSKGFPSRLAFACPGSHRSIDIVTSRGCHFGCTFCCIHLHMGREVRLHSVERVLDEIRELVEDHGVRNIHFEDDHLLADPARFKDILRGILERGWDLTWDTPNGVRADCIDSELLELCARSGCAYLIFGAESGSKRVLDTIVRKGLALDDITRAARLCWEHQIDSLAFYIVGMPGETREDLLKTYYFAMDLLRRYNTTPMFQVWRPYRDTAMERSVRDSPNVSDPVVYSLYRAHDIPYTLFYSRVYEDEEITLEFLAYYFDKYLRDVTRLAFVNWLRVARRRPAVLVVALAQMARIVLKSLATPYRIRTLLREYLISPGIMPFAQLRGLGRSGVPRRSRS